MKEGVSALAKVPDDLSFVSRLQENSNLPTKVEKLVLRGLGGPYRLAECISTIETMENLRNGKLYLRRVIQSRISEMLV